MQIPMRSRAEPAVSGMAGDPDWISPVPVTRLSAAENAIFWRHVGEGDNGDGTEAGGRKEGGAPGRI